MITRDLIRQGGLLPLREEALPSNATAVNIFANAHEDTLCANLCISAGTLTVTFLGATPVAATTGIDLPTGVYEFALSKSHLTLMKGIGGATGYIVYYGLP